MHEDVQGYLAYKKTPPRRLATGPVPRRDSRVAQQHGAARELFIDKLLVRSHFIIVLIRWTGLASWQFEFPFPGSRTSTILAWGPSPSRSSRGATAWWCHNLFMVPSHDLFKARQHGVGHLPRRARLGSVPIHGAFQLLLRVRLSQGAPGQPPS